MKGTDLKPRQTPVVLKVIYIGIFFLVVFLGFFYLYGYLWKKFGVSIVRSMSSSDYVLERTNVPCSINDDCISACSDHGTSSAYASCMCLKKMCYAVVDNQHFSQKKYCESDADCTVSCYEGPVSIEYYESVGGERNDCSEGCKSIIPINFVEESNPIACRNKQCQYTNGETCFIETIPKPTQ